MPARKKGIRAYLRTRKGRDPVWVIRDGAAERVIGGSGISQDEIEQALWSYRGQKHRYDTSERDPAQVQVTDVLTMYAENFAIHHACPKLVSYHMGHLNQFWAGKHLMQVKGETCRSYVERRMAQGRKPETARRELETLQAAIRRWHKESPLDAVPSVTLPPKGVPRQRFLERHEVAALLRAAHRLGAKHVARFIILGLYTGTRHDALLKLRWNPSLAGGYADLDRGLLYRRGTGERETKKRRPPFHLSNRLRCHLELWRRNENCLDRTIIHYHGVSIRKMRRAWATVVRESGLDTDVTPHVLRHTFATWALWEGKTIWEVAGLMGASAKMVDETYGHHFGANQGRESVAVKAKG